MTVFLGKLVGFFFVLYWLRKAIGEGLLILLVSQFLTIYAFTLFSYALLGDMIAKEWFPYRLWSLVCSIGSIVLTYHCYLWFKRER